MDQKAVEVFIQNWKVYQKIIERNYMHHIESGVLISEILDNAGDGIRVLDLGCGDATLISSLLGKTNPSYYKGVDLSASALEFARRNLEKLNVPFELKDGAMEGLINEEDGSYDVVYSSFAIHHLQDDQKSELIGKIYGKLLNRGWFIWTDVFREPEQTRDHYLNEYSTMVNDDWDALSASDKELVKNHIVNFDFPPQLPDALTWLENRELKLKFSDLSDRFHKTLIAQKIV